jgi:hypothetical protein
MDPAEPTDGLLPPNPGEAALRHRARLRRADRIFLVGVVHAFLLTAVWIWLMATGGDGGTFFGHYHPDAQALVRYVVVFVFYWVLWSYGFHWIKRGLLRRAGLSPEEIRLVSGTRRQGFDLEAFLARHPERTLRIIDMIARRGRMILLLLLGFSIVYLSILDDPRPDALAFGLHASLFDSLITSWWTLLAYRSEGIPGHISFGAQTRILDGVQGRANVLAIGMLWGSFKFVMIPLGLRLGELYPPGTYAILFAFIWFSYAVTDYASEIVGSIWGRHSIRVWGIGDTNRKSWEGVAAGFACTLALNLALVWSQGLGPGWYALGALLAVVNPAVELLSPRGTDDFTMATTNALICLGWGAWVLGP